ncbi:HET-domain-containing protein [Dendrothele bispora CBS 962.96]|uniref:HET-domain-containing protein n=1 Tax=Dendrothele bispora (strain CBS 962.96) TaxID=1314807 RepID=A0A4S8LXS5_DENBC|nr:HET-domain-containing protein [Dendrothele bispora CBS 962.96]
MEPGDKLQPKRRSKSSDKRWTPCYSDFVRAFQTASWAMHRSYLFPSILGSLPPDGYSNALSVQVSPHPSFRSYDLYHVYIDHSNTIITMRLLNTGTFKVKEFFNDLPRYVILSHTWEDEEVTFQDIQDLEVAKGKAGWSKVEMACLYARKHKFKWIWIDSCCINKESSAELSEAINSMYQYYLDAAVCYVFLSDVRKNENPREVGSTFRRSRWFSRGWTLQELLAPTYVVFLDNSWEEIGTKCSLFDAISAITTIPAGVITGGNIDRYSIAQKMSWAACRQTTRPEDQAYCLMGLFGVNMSPIYGEGGAKAFMRLQQEIIKISDDRSIFAWIASSEEEEPRGLLARSPYEFRASGEVQSSESDIPGSKSSFSFNNNGLHIHIPLVPSESHSEDGLFLASLQCRSQRDGSYISLYLQQTASDGRYVRCRASELLLQLSSPSLEEAKLVVVKENQLPVRARSRKHSFLPRPVALHCVYRKDLSWYTKRKSTVLTSSVSQTSVENNLVYSIREERFSIAMQYNLEGTFTARNLRCRMFTETTNPTVSEVIQCPKVHFQESDTWANCTDRIMTPLKNGGMATFTVHVTGEERELRLEVAYILQPEERVSIPMLMKSPMLDCLVPSRIDIGNLSSPFVLTNVFPPDYFQSQQDNKTYVSVPAEANSNLFRVLTYQSQWWLRSGSCEAFVVFGFQDNELWTDVVVVNGPHEEHPRVEEIWTSYLDGGPRAHIRRGYQISVSHPMILWSWLTINARKRENLQLGTSMLSQLTLEFKYARVPCHFVEVYVQSIPYPLFIFLSDQLMSMVKQTDLSELRKTLSYIANHHFKSST